MLHNVGCPHHALSLPVRGAWIEMQTLQTPNALCGSLPVRGAWIEIRGHGYPSQLWCRRSPCGERGLKFKRRNLHTILLCRSPCGERGLKCKNHRNKCTEICRSPCGERGLKYDYIIARSGAIVSLPVRGAWIEIANTGATADSVTRRSPCGERGLKSFTNFHEQNLDWSLPVRGAWIEIVLLPCNISVLKVAPRAGSVD